MKTILIVGTSFHTLRDYILEHGMEYVTLRDIRTAKNIDKKLKRRVVCDFSSESSIQEALKEVSARFSIDGVISTYENYVVHTAFIAEQLGLPGMPVSAAKACTDKELMRELFAKAPKKISPAFAEAKDEQTVRTFADTYGFPLILKPANLSKSLLVTKNHDLDELISNYNKTMANIDTVYKKYAPNNTPKLLIEEFMEGPIHSVDAFIDADGNPHVLEQVVDYQTGYDIGYDDNFHYSRLLPSKLSTEEITAIRETAALGCKALGMKSSPAHVEIIRTKDGPMIVEIGARNGGYRERMHALANGIDITANALALALNQPLSLNAQKNDYCAVLELFPKKPGIFSGISNDSILKDLKSLQYYAIKQTIGSHVGKSSDGYKMCAIIILSNPDINEFNKDLDFINEKVHVVTT